MADEKYAAALPHATKYFIVSVSDVDVDGLMLTADGQPATSLGGVESLIEQRVHSDPGADPRLVRISVGVEDLEVSLLACPFSSFRCPDPSPKGPEGRLAAGVQGAGRGAESQTLKFL